MNLEKVPEERSRLLVAFDTLQKAVRDFKSHIGENEADLSEFQQAMAACEAELDALDAELGQHAPDMNDAVGREIFRGLSRTAAQVREDLEALRAEHELSETVREDLIESLEWLLDRQMTLLDAFTPDSSN